MGAVSKNSAFCRETAGSFNKTSTKRDMLALQKEHQSQRRLQGLAGWTLPPPDAVSTRGST